jgi:cysteine sulfinate desulfinase/cysteine desulfurase-like protein
VTILAPDREGFIDPAKVRGDPPNTRLVSIEAANGEITIQRVSELGALCRERGVLYHTDITRPLAKSMNSPRSIWFVVGPQSLRAEESAVLASGEVCASSR